MRVIAGKYKGRQLRTVADLSVRPATGRVKGSVFNILQNRVDWTEASVLDLFAGSGGLGIEALSRGARRVVFVENSKRAVGFLKQNISSIAGFCRVRNHCCRCVRVPRAAARDSSMWFLPILRTDFEVLNRLPSLIFQSGVVSPEGYLIIEHPQQLRFEQSRLWESGGGEEIWQDCCHVFPITARKPTMKIALYPGTFDPITNGHLDILERGMELFDKVIVTVAKNSTKSPLFDEEERVEMIREIIKHKQV